MKILSLAKRDRVHRSYEHAATLQKPLHDSISRSTFLKESLNQTKRCFVKLCPVSLYTSRLVAGENTFIDSVISSSVEAPKQESFLW
ncbi:hypothetical protein F2Q69_00013237 [Brassica cretica]|uniref:Uncharacterized protein n=1 Tax=Brassica cretica TaxID=69181 RepID=A0A8S9R5W4_BRACR|nr:hypothetical protein F2Q69_00013237 [Brassica cretica]